MIFDDLDAQMHRFETTSDQNNWEPPVSLMMAPPSAAPCKIHPVPDGEATRFRRPSSAR